MPIEQFLPLFHDYAPFSTPSQIYVAPSGYQAMVHPIRQVSASTATTVGVSLYQGSGVQRRLLQNNLQVDPEGVIVDDAPLIVTATAGIFASANVASGVVLHVQGIITPI